MMALKNPPSLQNEEVQYHETIVKDGQMPQWDTCYAQSCEKTINSFEPKDPPLSLHHEH